MNLSFRCVLLAVTFADIAACIGCAPTNLDDLPNLSRNETLWTSPSGSKVVIYRYGMAVGKTPEALVCEKGKHRDLIERLPADSFATVNGNELKVIREKGQTLPGWYRISRRSDLNWWQRTFSDEELGRVSWIDNQTSLPKPAEALSRNAVFSFNGGRWQKLADESKLKDLFGIPGEGLVFVGEPGIGVRQVLELLQRCP